MNEITDTQQTALFKAIKKILRPLVSMLLRQGITYTSLIDLLKTTYVEVADQQFALEGKKQTDSRISVLTGVHRKEVKRIREQEAAPMEAKERKASLSAQLIATWLGNPDYLDGDGRPKAIPRTSEDKEVSFDTMVRCVTKDVHPRSILDEWLHQGVAAIDCDGLVQLQEAGYVPEEDFEEKLFFAGKNIGDHLSVVTHNLAGEQTPMLDRAVYYGELTENSVKELEDYAKAAALELLTEVNQMASRLQHRDQEAETKAHAMHFGTYFYCCEQTQTDSDRVVGAEKGNSK
ncbi:DUF6502 family protein [Thiomicrorhabdus sp. ZW0627]|uniref:DUF6502 family protein n=1 Tax=Thiomicrorhabdus sp. ZW0627 TaxID=3039774 RepID=UPI002436FC7C|nr:DUF6502 family protein [Thiomicrorhabdus sp. ZW0627]MDG6773441.1 DUF6502 family protein [Thiomicrorhabdus sp. ZW0627]